MTDAKLLDFSVERSVFYPWPLGVFPRLTVAWMFAVHRSTFSRTPPNGLASTLIFSPGQRFNGSAPSCLLSRYEVVPPPSVRAGCCRLRRWYNHMCSYVFYSGPVDLQRRHQPLDLRITRLTDPYPSNGPVGFHDAFLLRYSAQWSAFPCDQPIYNEDANQWSWSPEVGVEREVLGPFGSIEVITMTIVVMALMEMRMAVIERVCHDGHDHFSNDEYDWLMVMSYDVLMRVMSYHDDGDELWWC